MSRKESLVRHKTIIQKLRSRPSSFDEILEKLESISDITLSKRTFQRDLVEIEELYGIEIKFDHSKKVYCIISEHEDQYTDRMFEALDVFQALNLNNSMSSFIQFDTRKPKGTEHLNGLLHAIQNRMQVQITYHKFWEDQSCKRTIEPYLLKEFNGRWYVIVFDLEKKALRTFALDRILELRFSDIKFQHPQKTDVRKFFEDCFGIIGPNNKKVETIKLLFIENQGKYIKTMPLHHSQQILEENDAQTIVQLNLFPNYDFIMEILSYGEFVKVLEPKALADEVKNRLERAVEVYNS